MFTFIVWNTSSNDSTPVELRCVCGIACVLFLSFEGHCLEPRSQRTGFFQRKAREAQTAPGTRARIGFPLWSRLATGPGMRGLHANLYDFKTHDLGILFVLL